MPAQAVDPGTARQQRHLLRLIQRDAGPDGWATVSAAVWPLLAILPDDLVELEPGAPGGRVRLTADGAAVVRHLPLHS